MGKYSSVNPFNPETEGVCDRCGFTWLLRKLSEQFRWVGPRLVGTGWLVCPKCMDVPLQAGFRTITIGPDPVPVKNPRPGAVSSFPVEQFVLDDPEDGVLDGDSVLS